MYVRIEESFLNRYLPSWRSMTDVEILRRYADIIESGVLCQSDQPGSGERRRSPEFEQEDPALRDANMRR